MPKTNRRPKPIDGELKQYDDPEWEPLLRLAGEHITGAFMWMHEIALGDGRSVHAYKHRMTRRYVHLGTDGAAYISAEEGYLPTPAFRALYLTLDEADIDDLPGVRPSVWLDD